MPTVDIFLPPLLGGFLFVSLFYPLRFWTQREQGYKLVFAAAIAGMFLLLLSHFLITAFGAQGSVQAALDWWYALVSVPNSATSALAFLLGVVAIPILNALIQLIPAWRPFQIRRWHIVRTGDALETILFDHLVSQSLVAVTLKTGKVYVGLVNMSINPARRAESVRLSLERSGYREPGTHRLNLDVDYEKTHQKLSRRKEQIVEETIREVIRSHRHLGEGEVIRLAYQRMADNPELNALAVNFEVVVQTSEIISVAPFRPDIYAAYFEKGDAA